MYYRTERIRAVLHLTHYINYSHVYLLINLPNYPTYLLNHEPVYFIYLQTNHTSIKKFTASQNCKSSQGLTTWVMPVVEKKNDANDDDYVVCPGRDDASLGNGEVTV